jgi:hypothetical protein
MRESENASKPHSYAESFSASGRRGPRRKPSPISTEPSTKATPRKIRMGT